MDQWSGWCRGNLRYLADRRQTPMPYIIAVHMKQATTMLLFVLPFTLVDGLGIKMVPLMFFIALIYMG